MLVVESTLILVVSVVINLFLLESIDLVNFIKRFVAAVAETASDWDVVDGYLLEVLDLR